MSGRLYLVALLGLCFLIPTSVSAAAAEKKASPPAARHAPPPPLPPVNVNVTVNVRVSRDVNVDVKIDAPCTPVIGSVQLPDAVQRLLSGLLFRSSPPPSDKAAPAPAKKK